MWSGLLRCCCSQTFSASQARKYTHICTHTDMTHLHLYLFGVCDCVCVYILKTTVPLISSSTQVRSTSLPFHICNLLLWLAFILVHTLIWPTAPVYNWSSNSAVISFLKQTLFLPRWGSDRPLWEYLTHTPKSGSKFSSLCSKYWDLVGGVSVTKVRFSYNFIELHKVIFFL